MGKEREKEGLVEDLIDKIRKEEVTEGEAYQEIYRRGLEHGKYSSRVSNTVMTLGFILPYLPVVVAVLDVLGNVPSLAPFVERLAFLRVLVLMPRIFFPQIVVYLAIVTFVISLIVMVYAVYLRAKKGGCGWKGESETVMLVTEGVYNIVRHPANLCFGLVLLSVTVGLSNWLPFTPLSVIGNILVFLGVYRSSVEEEKLDLLKWGEKYQRYMEKVPRFNFLLGIWRLATSDDLTFNV
ncbi:MAG: methyltransferase family protein [Candidatus Bathyarchaeia archaeon]